MDPPPPLSLPLPLPDAPPAAAAATITTTPTHESNSNSNSNSSSHDDAFKNVNHRFHSTHLYVPLCCLRFWPHLLTPSSSSSNSSSTTTSPRPVAAASSSCQHHPPPTPLCPSCHALSKSIMHHHGGGGADMAVKALTLPGEPPIYIVTPKQVDQTPKKVYVSQEAKEGTLLLPPTHVERSGIAASAKEVGGSSSGNDPEVAELSSALQQRHGSEKAPCTLLLNVDSAVDGTGADKDHRQAVSAAAHGHDEGIGMDDEDDDGGDACGDKEMIFRHLLSTWSMPGRGKLSSMSSDMYRRLQRHFRSQEPPPCAACYSPRHVRFRYFNNFRKSYVLQPRYVCRSPLHNGKFYEFSQPHSSSTRAPPPTSTPTVSATAPSSSTALWNRLPTPPPPPPPAPSSNCVDQRLPSSTSTDVDNNNIIQLSSTADHVMHTGGVILSARPPAAASTGGAYYYPYFFPWPLQQRLVATTPPEGGGSVGQPEAVRNASTMVGQRWQMGGGAAAAHNATHNAATTTSMWMTL